ncbi:MAG: RNA 2'-phosphotransferase [Pseudomonadota bacterium]
MSASTIEISKLLSYVLRHKPDAIDLALDPEDWAEISELIEKAEFPLTLDLLQEFVATNDKKRFAISADGLSIRANQGYSIDVDLGLQAVEPPEFLFQSTAKRLIESLRQQGLLPRKRQYVHLSADADTAKTVGQPHGKPVVLSIPALQMHVQGHKFFHAANGVWFTGHVLSGPIQD